MAGVIANLPGLSAGLSMGFSAILIPQLQEPGAEITASLEQGSWIASLFVIGDLLGCVIGGPIADRSVPGAGSGHHHNSVVLCSSQINALHHHL